MKSSVISNAATLYLSKSQTISNTKQQLDAIDQLYSPTNAINHNRQTTEPVVNSLHISPTSSFTTELDAGHLQGRSLSSSSSTTTTVSKALLASADSTLTNNIVHFHGDLSGQSAIQKPLLRLEHPDHAAAEGEEAQQPLRDQPSCFRRLFCCGF